MEKTFFFVNGIDADKSSKKLMRRHVMKGKNAGRTIHRPSRLALQVARREPHGPDWYINSRLRIRGDAYQQEKDAEWIHWSMNTLARSVGDVILPASLPVEVTPHSLKVINRFFVNITDRIYPIRLGLSFHDVKLMWLRVLSLDADAYTCTIYMMQACNELFLGDGDSSPTALYHLSQTFAAVNKRLQSDEALSDSTIAIVLSLIQQEQMRNQQSAAEVHLRGLGRIIELRGGIDQLELGGNPLIVLKICKTDVMFALQYGGPILFSRDRMPDVRKILATKGILLEGGKFDITSSSAASDRLDPALQDILLDVTDVCSLFNIHLRNLTLDCLNFLEIVISLFYRLLRFGTLNEARPQSTMDAAYHIGLVVFAMTMLTQRGRRRMIKCGLISRRLREVVDGRLDGGDDELALFWLTFMGGIWVADDVDGDWFALKMRVLAQRLGIDSWGKAQVALGKLPWLNSLHDDPGRELWDRAHKRQ